MLLRTFALLLLFQSVVGCQENAQNTLISQANVGFHAQKTALEDAPSASNIVFQSADGGQTWQDVSAGLPATLSSLGMGRVYIDQNEIVLLSGKGLHRSPTGKTVPVWENERMYDMEISNLFPGKDGPYVSHYENGIFKQVVGTHILIPLNNDLTDKRVRTILETPGGTLFVGCESGLFKSTDSGQHWKKVFDVIGVNSLAVGDGVLICGTYDGLMRSTDDGEHWDVVFTEEGSSYKTQFVDGRFLSITQGGDWRDNPTNRVRYSEDGGKTWQRMAQPEVSGQFVYGENTMNASTVHMIFDIEKLGQHVFCSTNAGIFRSADWGKTWEPVLASRDKEQFELAVSGNILYAVPVAGC